MFFKYNVVFEIFSVFQTAYGFHSYLCKTICSSLKLDSVQAFTTFFSMTLFSYTPDTKCQTEFTLTVFQSLDRYRPLEMLVLPHTLDIYCIMFCLGKRCAVE